MIRNLRTTSVHVWKGLLDKHNGKACVSGIPAGLVVGCKKVKEFVPKVRLARFHRESLPSRLVFPK